METMNNRTIGFERLSKYRRNEEEMQRRITDGN